MTGAPDGCVTPLHKSTIDNDTDIDRKQPLASVGVKAGMSPLPSPAGNTVRRSHTACEFP